ncbi:hypothetical protein B0H12DRAFT_326432 [Mycena haematopus]|nr:hypothetical protein B0H12DRAFT_326432 [Mycena haematopus]
MATMSSLVRENGAALEMVGTGDSLAEPSKELRRRSSSIHILWYYAPRLTPTNLLEDASFQSVSNAAEGLLARLRWGSCRGAMTRRVSRVGPCTGRRGNVLSLTFYEVSIALFQRTAYLFKKCINEQRERDILVQSSVSLHCSSFPRVFLGMDN